MRRAVTIISFVFVLATGCGHSPLPPLQVLGVWHSVAPGDTVEKVAERYGADPEAVAELNDLEMGREIVGREEIFVPKSGGEKPGTGASPPAPLGEVADVSEKAPAATAPTHVGTCGKEGRPCFAWPARGKLSSLFGKRGDSHHDGIDIVAPEGTPVTAAEKGKVIYAGDKIKGYGNLVLIKHAGGLITVYAHNAAVSVSEGDQVEKGQKVAEVGDTGSATTAHLHFEVRKGETPVDPLGYLPSKEN